MIQERRALFNKSQTAKEMYGLINRYHKDLRRYKLKVGKKVVPIKNLTIRQFFDFVRKIPYRVDTKPTEVIARPKHIMKHRYMGMDCKKKSILMGSFLRLKGVPFYLGGSSRKKDGRIHHVFARGKVNGTYRNIDPTYNFNIPFDRKRVTNFEIL